MAVHRRVIKYTTANKVLDELETKIKKIKKMGKWMSLSCTVGYKWVTVMDDVNG